MNIQSENTVHKIILEKSINNIKNVYRKFSFIQENYNSYQFKYNFFFVEINQKKYIQPERIPCLFLSRLNYIRNEYIIYFPVSAITSVKHFTQFKV